jgi:hypothetical protein
MRQYRASGPTMVGRGRREGEQRANDTVLARGQRPKAGKTAQLLESVMTRITSVDQQHLIVCIAEYEYPKAVVVGKRTNTYPDPKD